MYIAYIELESTNNSAALGENIRYFLYKYIIMITNGVNMLMLTVITYFLVVFFVTKKNTLCCHSRCLSVRPSVRPSVRLSVRLSVRPSVRRLKIGLNMDN